MKYADDTSGIFSRYDVSIEVARQKTREISHDPLLQRVVDSLVNGDEAGTEEDVRRALEHTEPMEVIDRGLIPGMKEVSRLWAEGVYFLPQVILSSDAMIAGIAVCEEKLGRPLKKKGKVITHTAEGDIHDIGQSIVNALLNASGFEVIDLGVDVPVEQVVEACRVHKPLLLTGTALMTTTMTAFPRIAARLKELGLDLPFVCGGGAVTEEFVTGFDLGIWGKDASQAPEMAEDAMNGMTWREMRAKWNG